MKRYDSDEDMALALDVFLFDTLSDPDQQFADEVPAEASADEVSMYAIKVGDRTFDANHLPDSRRELRALMALLISPAKGLDAAGRRGRAALVVACAQRALDLTD